MNLGEYEEKSDSEAPEVPQLNGNPKISDIFKRDLTCWLSALVGSWWLLLVLPIVFGLSMLIFRTLTTPKVYSSSCALVRHSVNENRSTDIPAGYTSVQMSVIFNMIRNRTCLTETARRLKLNVQPEQLFKMVRIKQAEQHSDYFFVTADSGSPQMSADIANTLSEVFLDEYKKFIQININESLRSGEDNQKNLRLELDVLQRRIDTLGKANHLNSFAEEMANNTQRITLAEDRLQQGQIQLEALSNKIRNLSAQLELLPPEVVVYSERSTARDQRLTDMKLELATLEQRYTSDNPIVEKQKMLIAALEKEMSSKKDDGQTKIVSGKNAEYTNIHTELMKSTAEKNSLETVLEGYRNSLATFIARRQVLNQLAPQLNMLEEQLAQKKDLLLKQELATKKLQLFQDRKFSDISIMELAPVPQRALPRKRMIFVLIGVFVGVVLASVIALGKEAINLSVRSKTDLEQALRLPALGIIPRFAPEHRADFYSALQAAVANAQAILTPPPDEEGNQPPIETPMMISIACVSHSDLNPELLNELCEILKVRKDFNYRIIRMAEAGHSSNIAKYLINDFLYGLSNTLPDAGKDQVLYFKLDDLAFISPPPEERLAEIRNALKDCDFIIWELFEFDLHRQLFTEICKVADMTVIPMRFGKTSKWNIFQELSQLKAFKVERISGLLYDVQNHIYRRVSL